MSDPTLYRLIDIDSDDPEYGLGNSGTMYRGRVEPVKPDAVVDFNDWDTWPHDTDQIYYAYKIGGTT